MRICIFTASCSGKSTFCKKYNNNYKGLFLLDCDDLKMDEKENDIQDEAIQDYLYQFDDACLLTNKIKQHEDVLYSCVDVGMASILLHIFKRILLYRKLKYIRNVFLKVPLYLIFKIRMYEENIPIFKTFEQAIDYHMRSEQVILMKEEKQCGRSL